MEIVIDTQISPFLPKQKAISENNQKLNYNHDFNMILSRIAEQKAINWQNKKQEVAIPQSEQREILFNTGGNQL